MEESPFGCPEDRRRKDERDERRCLQMFHGWAHSQYRGIGEEGVRVASDGTRPLPTVRYLLTRKARREGRVSEETEEKQLLQLLK
jgi:hypothetical protein